MKQLHLQHINIAENCTIVSKLLNLDLGRALLSLATRSLAAITCIDKISIYARHLRYSGLLQTTPDPALLLAFSLACGATCWASDPVTCRLHIFFHKYKSK